MINILFEDKQVIFATNALMTSVMGVMNLATLPRIAPTTKFLHQECHASISYLTQGINTPTTRGTDHTPIMAPDIGDISGAHSPTLIQTATEAAILEGTPCALLPATAAAHSAPEPMDAPISPHAMVPTGIVTLHPTLATSPMGSAHANSQNRADLVPATPATQHKDISPRESSNVQDPLPHKHHYSKTVTI